MHDRADDEQADAEAEDRADVDVALFVLDRLVGHVRPVRVMVRHAQCAVLGVSRRSMIGPSASANCGS